MSTSPATGQTLTLTLMNTKGGVGKTTSSVFLAAAFHAAGHTVQLWDADPQGSLSEWLADAEDTWNTHHEDPFPVAYDAVNRSSLNRRTPTAEILIIDTAPGDPSIQSAVAARADLVIIPTEASRLDMSRVWVTVDALGPHVPSIVLLNRANTRTRLHAEAVQALTEEGVPFFETTIARREAFKQAAGTWPAPNQLGPWAEITTEIEEMIQQ
ncbi:ParA family protein [Micrococcus luteus]|uniref:ParA family protein n=1 Tax=Micrococcus luteus TaxID=1270 RepID=UPI00191093CE|nr:ParA family protein [Micrococcus luteus]QQE48232.1 ParA family protein [Micrococcus luteus]